MSQRTAHPFPTMTRFGSTANYGAPDDIEITDKGSVVPTGGTAVTLDSGNDVKNAGTIQISDASNAAGIRATATGSGAITNSGKIVLDEDYTPKIGRAPV